MYAEPYTQGCNPAPAMHTQITARTAKHEIKEKTGFTPRFKMNYSFSSVGRNTFHVLGITDPKQFILFFFLIEVKLVVRK